MPWFFSCWYFDVYVICKGTKKIEKTSINFMQTNCLNTKKNTKNSKILRGVIKNWLHGQKWIQSFIYAGAISKPNLLILWFYNSKIKKNLQLSEIYIDWLFHYICCLSNEMKCLVINQVCTKIDRQTDEPIEILWEKKNIEFWTEGRHICCVSAIR